MMATPPQNAPGRPAGRLHLYLARHGETVWNTESRMQGRGNSDLTESGLAGARRLALELAAIPLTAAYSSPARRALETAQLALAGRPVRLLTDERIQEMALGRYEGLTVSEAYALDPENMDAFFHHAERFKPRGGESFAEVMERIAWFLDDLAAGFPDSPQDLQADAPCGAGPADRHVLVISHNITVKAMLAVMRRLPLEHLRDGRHIPQATLIPAVFEPADGTYRLEPEAERILK